MKKPAILAAWIDIDSFNFYCEYCSNENIKHIYLPFHKNVLNPSHICNNCVIAYQIIDWIDTEADYYKLLEEIKNQ